MMITAMEIVMNMMIIMYDDDLDHNDDDLDHNHDDNENIKYDDDADNI